MRLLPGIYASALTAAVALTSTFPVNAAPIFVPRAQAAQTDVIQIQDGARWRRNFRRGGHNWNRNNFRRGGRYAWHNGHRGYRHYRRGYRELNGFWFPGGAFIAGAVIGSVIANNNDYYDGYYDYEDRRYGRRYYADRYYGDRHYGEYYANGRPCSPRLDDAGKCRSFDSGYYGNYRRRVVILDR